MTLVFILCMLSSLSLGQTRTDSTTILLEEEVRVWHEQRVKNLLRDYGWLTLIALDWLENGNNEIKNIGTLTLKNGTVSLQVNPGVKATLHGRPFTSGTLRIEGEGSLPDTITVGTRAFIVIQRGDRFAVRMWDTEARTRKEFSGIERFPVKSEWRIEARWEPYNPPKRMKVATVIPGYEQEYPVPGVAIFTIGGKEFRLEPVLESPEADYFFIFGDLTNRRETYAGGRYLYAKREQGGKVILDFNKCYNPPCAFTAYATCPLPPPQNKLPIRIEAGEKRYGKH